MKNNQRIMIASFVTLLLVTEIVAELMLKTWATSSKTQFLVLGVASYVLLSLIFAKSMQNNSITAINTAWQCGNVALVSIIGVFFLKESISNPQKIGVFLACVSTILMFF